jgi:hypothetical protein
MWKKAVIIATIVIAIVLGIISVKPAGTQSNELIEKTNYRIAMTKELPFLKPFPLNGFGISGAWEGPGYAEVWLVADDEKRYLVFDTHVLPTTLELSAFGERFEGVCIDTCRLPDIMPRRLFVLISGPGILSIDALHFAAPLNPSGLAIQKIKQSDAPDHSMLVLVMLLAVAVIGAHTCGHFCSNPVAKKVLIFVFLGAFLVLGGVFGVAIAAPTTAIAVTAKKAASVCAAAAFIILFILLAVEMMQVNKDPVQASPSVWSELENAEETWERKK